MKGVKACSTCYYKENKFVQARCTMCKYHFPFKYYSNKNFIVEDLGYDNVDIIIPKCQACKYNKTCLSYENFCQLEFEKQSMEKGNAIIDIDETK